MDLIWVARVPTCVKSPDVIIKVRMFVQSCSDFYDSR